jgi:hypothetical protein
MADDPFDDFVRGGLELNGLGLQEGELDVIRTLHAAFAPAFDGLDAVDLSEIPPEVGLDPSRAPA